MNIFIEHIYNKRKYDVIRWLKYKIFLRKLNKVTPNFGMLWQIADFIKLLEDVYFYNNTNRNPLYSSRSYNDGENGLIFTNENVSVVFKLYEYTEEVVINVTRKRGNGLKNSYILNEDSKFEDYRQEMTIANITDLLMTAVRELLNEFYDKKVC